MYNWELEIREVLLEGDSKVMLINNNQIKEDNSKEDK